MLAVSNSKRKPCRRTIAAHEALLLGLRFGIVLAGCVHTPGCEYLGERGEMEYEAMASRLAILFQILASPVSYSALWVRKRQ